MEKESLNFKEIPFEELPNFPKPVIPKIDLGISEEKLFLKYRPTVTDDKRIGYFVVDRDAQTDQSEIIDVDTIIGKIALLLLDLKELHKDLNYAKVVMREDYEKRLDQKAFELYLRANTQVEDLEQVHKEKIEVIRKSYRSQLSNAISKIAGEYEAYYEELLAGKTGRQDKRIQELRRKLELLEFELEKSNTEIKRLTKEGAELLVHSPTPRSPRSPRSPFGISQEEADKLREVIQELEEEMEETKARVAEREYTIKKLNQQSEKMFKQLEEEKQRVIHLRIDLENEKKKAQADKEAAARMAQMQQATMEKQWKEKIANAEKEASKKAAEDAELQRMKDQARYLKEMEEQRALEERLREEASHKQSIPMDASEAELKEQVQKLSKLNEIQREQLRKLQKEFDRANRVWETKLAIAQKNFHALRDECFLRQSLQRQGALLHHATVGYATSNHAAPQSKYFKPLPKLRHSNRVMTQESEDDLIKGTSLSELPPELPPAPTPTPLHTITRDEVLRPWSVHYRSGGSSAALSENIPAQT